MCHDDQIIDLILYRRVLAYFKCSNEVKFPCEVMSSTFTYKTLNTYYGLDQTLCTTAFVHLWTWGSEVA